MVNEQVEILLVEDDPDDLDLSLRALNEAHVGNRIEIARDGEEALDFLFRRGRYADRDSRQQPKLVLLDLKLPKVEGLEVLRQIKQNQQTKAIPVVIMTSSKQERDMIDGYGLGANSYIQKPVDFDQFQTTIKELGYYWLLINHPPPSGSFERDGCYEKSR